MKTLLLLVLLLMPMAVGAELPDGSTVVYSGTADVPGYQATATRPGRIGVGSSARPTVLRRRKPATPAWEYFGTFC